MPACWLMTGPVKRAYKADSTLRHSDTMKRDLGDNIVERTQPGADAPVTGPLPSGTLSGHWKLNDGAGTTAVNSAGTQNMAIAGSVGWGTLASGTPAVSIPAAPTTPPLVKASGVTLNTATVVAPATVAGYTITATVRVDAASSGNPYIVESKSANGDIAVALNLSAPVAGSPNWALQGSVKSSGGTVYPWGGYVIPPGQDTKVAITVGQTTIKLFVNGVQVGSDTAYSGTPTSGTDFVIGSDWWGGTGSGSPFTGQIADVRLFNSPLTPQTLRRSKPRPRGRVVRRP